ncbi:MAG: hypothetical protein, partial [Olavius algarvensis Gamma 1 endosymbiont]
GLHVVQYLSISAQGPRPAAKKGPAPDSPYPIILYSLV